MFFDVGQKIQKFSPLALVLAVLQAIQMIGLSGYGFSAGLKIFGVLSALILIVVGLLATWLIYGFGVIVEHYESKIRP